jgi:Immunity protein 8
MIIAELKNVFTSDMDDLATYRPEDSSSFQLTVRAMIGPQNGVGAESFDIQVCTPAWLEKECERFGFCFGKHRLVIRKYDPAQIKSILASLVQRSSGDSWEAVAVKLSQVAHWEFDNYQA